MPSALKNEHPALQNLKILYFLLFLWVIFALLDPDPDPTTQINADPDPDPKPCIKYRIIEPEVNWRSMRRKGRSSQSLLRTFFITKPCANCHSVYCAARREGRFVTLDIDFEVKSGHRVWSVVTESSELEMLARSPQQRALLQMVAGCGSLLVFLL